MIKDRSNRQLTSILFLLLFCISPLNSQTSGLGDFRSGDGVRIIVWQEPGSESANIDDLGLSNDYIIENDGHILLPLIGEILVLGRSQNELAEYLKDRFGLYASGLHFITKPLIRVALLGAVHKPGLYLVESNSSLWELIGEAEGPQADANLEKIFISRSGEIVAEDLLEKTENAYTLREIGVQSGDQVTVLQHTSFNWRTLLSFGSFFISLTSLAIQINRQ
ncbi:MAG: hypothetical protein DWQ05_19920 [Calditrichaeota bacterium]|nr:MAG: hypothetical protein DWQ05_19920 [Calditrichota bacterium]